MLSPLQVRRTLILVLGLFLAIRLAAALLLGDTAEPIGGAFDQYSYDVLGARFAEGKGFTFPVEWYPGIAPNSATAFWSFGYTLYLAGIYKAVGHHPVVPRLIQVVLSAAIPWLLYRIGRRLFDEATGITAAALSAIYAYLIFFNVVLMTQTFYIVCLLAALDLALALAAQPSRTGWVGLGAALGLGTLFRQTLLLVAPLLLMWVAWQRASRALHGRGQGGQPRPDWQPLEAAKQVGASDEQSAKRVPDWIRGSAVTLSIIAACVLPFTLRNYLTFHDFLLLNSNGGYWFYASNHPAQGTNFDPNLTPPIPAALAGLAEPARDRALFHEAPVIITSEPVRFLQLSLNRTKDYFWVLPSDQSSGLSNLARTLSFALYAPFMLAGIFLSRHQWRLCLPLYLYLAFDTVLHLSSWAAPRYRLPSDTILMIFAALCLVRLAQALGPRLHRAWRVSA